MRTRRVARAGKKAQGGDPAEDLVGQLVAQARERGLDVVGEGGLLQRLTKRVLEPALEGEITDHLGYDKHDPAGKYSGNSRTGHRSKTVTTDVGSVEITVPRDRAGSFEPQLVKKRQRRLTGVDEMVLSLSAEGLTHGEISVHLAEVYGASVSKQTISTIGRHGMNLQVISGPDGSILWVSNSLPGATAECRLGSTARPGPSAGSVQLTVGVCPSRTTGPRQHGRSGSASRPALGTAHHQRGFGASIAEPCP